MQDGRRCRKCGATPATARFVPGCRTRCQACRAADKAQRSARLALKPKALVVAPARVVGSVHSTAHLAWVRTQPCAVGLPSCGTITHAHHVREGTGGGTAKKPADRWAVPLCPAHHSELHTRGAITFGEKYRVDLRAMAERLAAASPALAPGEEPWCRFD